MEITNFFVNGREPQFLSLTSQPPPSTRYVIVNAVDDAGGSTLYWNGRCKVKIEVEFIHKELGAPGLHRGRCKKIS